MTWSINARDWILGNWPLVLGISAAIGVSIIGVSIWQVHQEAERERKRLEEAELLEKYLRLKTLRDRLGADVPEGQIRDALADLVRAYG